MIRFRTLKFFFFSPFLPFSLFKKKKIFSLRSHPLLFISHFFFFFFYSTSFFCFLKKENFRLDSSQTSFFRLEESEVGLDGPQIYDFLTAIQADITIILASIKDHVHSILLRNEILLDNTTNYVSTTNISWRGLLIDCVLRCAKIDDCGFIIT
jgi:hypothetical protein